MAVQEQTRPLLISRWASRIPPGPRALRPGYVGIDERSFTDILAESVHFSRFLRYFDARDLPDGTWETLLAADHGVSLALLATLDVERRSSAIEILVRRVRGEEDVGRKKELLRRLILAVLRLAADIDRWLGPAGHLGHEGHGTRHVLERQIGEVLAPRLRRLLATVAAAERDGFFGEALTIRVGHFRSIWLIETVEPGEISFEAETWIGTLLDDVAEHIDGFVAGVAALASRSAAELEGGLEDGRHAPHIGLLMAFIRLFRHAQDELNALPGRIASFYQEAILRERPRPALPDRTYLAFKPVSAAPTPEIPAGMLFPAGKDEAGTPIEFAAESALAVTGARLTDIRVWQPLTADGARQRINAAGAPLVAEGSIGMNLFGAPGLPPAAVGLVVAAPLLELKSGARQVTIRFLDVDPPAVAPEILAAVLRKAFRLSFTSTGGWIDVAEFGAEAAGRDIAFSFAIVADGPPLAVKAPADPAAASPGPPAIRLMLVQDKVGDVAPLALLGAMRFGAVRIEVAVEGLGGLVVSTSAGEAAAAPGVAAFGPVPMPGSSLRIDHPAFAAAPLDRIALGLSWLGLPPDIDGFAGYYRQYVVGPDRILSSTPLFTDDCFRVDVCAPVGAGKWIRDARLFHPVDSSAPDPEVAPPPPAEAEPVSASQSAPAQAETAPPHPDDGATDTRALRGTTWFAIDGDSPDSGEDECPGSALLVTLTEPPYGFGASLYPVNVAYASSLIAAGEGAEMRRESLPSRLWRWLLKLLKKLLGLLRDALKAVIAPATMLWKLLSGGARWLRDLIFIRTDFYDHPDGIEFDAPPPLPVPERSGEISPAAAFPNPPWQPILAAIRVNYASHAAWGEGAAEGAIRLFHVAPLEGRVEIELKGRPCLLPALPEQPSFDLRIAGWPAGKPLCLLFLMAPRQSGGGPPPAISWQYRTEAGWQTIDLGKTGEDGTAGLSATGILTLPPLVRESGTLRFRLARERAANDEERPQPVDAAVEPEEDSEALWLRATAKGPGLGFPPIARILPDALSASRYGVGGETILPPVPAGTIAQAPGIRGIAKVEQPIGSFGGAPAEDEARLPLRTSARLRHKERAVLGWDVEHLLLERFPQIDRVRVLPACSPETPGEAAPGHVTAILIPARGGATPPDPLRPATPPDLRDSVALWLSERCSPFARIHVVDPIYDPVNVKVSAWFGAARGGAAMLREDLAALLSPWSEHGLDLPDEAGPRALQARIFQFVRTRPYVAAVGSVKIDLGGIVPKGEWRVPVAGALDVAALSRPPATGC